MKKHNVSKLPKWAQEEISLLYRKLEDAQCSAATLAGMHPDTDTLIHNYEGPDVELERGSTVRFLFDPKDRDHNYLDVRMSVGFNNEPALQVMAIGESLMVKPVCSNVVMLQLVRD